MNNRKGFTLIELLVVISIIALLSTVVLSSVKAARAKATKAAVMSGVLELAKSLEIHYSQTGTYDGYVVPGNYFWDQPSDCKDGVNTYRNREFISDEGARICESILSNLMTVQTGVGDMSLHVTNNGRNYTIKAKTVNMLNYSSGIWFCVDNFGDRRMTSYTPNMGDACKDQPS